MDKEKNISLKDIETLLGNQTVVILSAVEEKLLKSEERTSRKIERLINTMDKFLKRTLDLEDEFTFMKHDLNRVKAVIQEKLGVDLL
ncbi:MAG: hypothetical protein NT170_04610 [Candidatus Moranbacteria bacterium]|nr:hypothetical protein [Candidatus Moranbacteria bacterium]